MRVLSPQIFSILVFFLFFLQACQKDPTDRFAHVWEIVASSIYQEDGLVLLDTTQQWELTLQEQGTGTLLRSDASIPVFWDYREADETIEIRLEEPTIPQVSTLIFNFQIESSGWRRMIWQEERNLLISNDHSSQSSQQWLFTWELHR